MRIINDCRALSLENRSSRSSFKGVLEAVIFPLLCLIRDAILKQEDEKEEEEEEEQQPTDCVYIRSVLERTEREKRALCCRALSLITRANAH